MVSSSRHEFTSNVRLSSSWSVCWLDNWLQRSCSNIFLSISMRLLFNIKYSKNADAQISSYRSNWSNVEKGRNRKLFYQTDSICSALFIVHRKLWTNAYWISKANFWDVRFSRLQFIEPQKVHLWDGIISCDMQHKTHWFSVIYCKYIVAYRRIEHAEHEGVCCWWFHYYRLIHLLHNIVHGKVYNSRYSLLNIITLHLLT